MRRRTGPAISASADCITTALQHCRVESPAQSTAIALIVLGVEMLEEEGRTESEVRTLFEQILNAPVRIDPRSDTRGT